MHEFKNRCFSQLFEDILGKLRIFQMYFHNSAEGHIYYWDPTEIMPFEVCFW